MGLFDKLKGKSKNSSENVNSNINVKFSEDYGQIFLKNMDDFVNGVNPNKAMQNILRNNYNWKEAYPNDRNLYLANLMLNAGVLDLSEYQEKYAWVIQNFPTSQNPNLDGKFDALVQIMMEKKM